MQKEVVTRSLREFNLKIAKATSLSEQRPGSMSVIIERPYSHLERELRRAFRQHSVRIIVNRRFGERRKVTKPVVAERRRTERRHPKELVVESIIWI